MRSISVFSPVTFKSGRNIFFEICHGHFEVSRALYWKLSRVKEKMSRPNFQKMSRAVVTGTFVFSKYVTDTLKNVTGTFIDICYGISIQHQVILRVLLVFCHVKKEDRHKAKNWPSKIITRLNLVYGCFLMRVSSTQFFLRLKFSNIFKGDSKLPKIFPGAQKFSRVPF